MKVEQIGNVMESGHRKNPNQGRVYDSKGLSPTLTDMQGGGRQPMIVDIKQATKEGYIPCEVGGGGRFELSIKPNTQRESNRQREYMSYSNDSEYP